MQKVNKSGKAEVRSGAHPGLLVSWASSGMNGDVGEEEEGAAATRGQEERARVPGRGLPRWVKRAEHARGARAHVRRKRIATGKIS
jgi:hypothetical protein